MEKIYALKFSPKILARDLDNISKRKRISILEIEEMIEDSKLYLDINVSTKSVEIDRELSGAKAVKIGCKSIIVELSIDNGEIIHYKGNNAIKVDYEIVGNKTNKLGIEYAKFGGKLVSNKDSSANVKSSYEDLEDILSSVYMTNMVNWTYKLPKGERVIREYIEDNIELFALCEFENKEKIQGEVRVKPRQVTFYNSEDKEAFSRKKSKVLEKTLTRRRIRIADFSDFRVKFIKFEKKHVSKN